MWSYAVALHSTIAAFLGTRKPGWLYIGVWTNCLHFLTMLHQLASSTSCPFLYAAPVSIHTLCKLLFISCMVDQSCGHCQQFAKWAGHQWFAKAIISPRNVLSNMQNVFCCSGFGAVFRGIFSLLVADGKHLPALICDSWWIDVRFKF